MRVGGVFEELERDQEQADIIIFGHTHQAEIRHEGNILLVNPGETYGWLHGRATIAMLEVPTLEVELIEL